ncbi:hypothetical protein P3X46_008130 [Hevea brasiliensis]|uniref:Benzyl alcohol O-benzoyltransferase n=1 Tax=Hevea brasiliensis TaxID=3981 RepID=A0ABQ9MKB2_HEVBR|nr:hypothetical protein P3X46_008130 [Hevea brasiliensis]
MPTPHEFKPLSDIDDQESLRFHIPFLHVYLHHPSNMQGKDPVKVIREALDKALVFYYPFAGGVREAPNRKILVECTGEGILFIEANAHVTLDQSGDALQPLLPYLRNFFLTSLAHLWPRWLGGERAPSILPVWERHVLSARNPPRVTCLHREYDEVEDNNRTSIARIPFPLHDMVDEFAHLHGCATFQILTASLWKCQTIALQPDPKQEMRIICLNNVHKKFNHSLLLEGYYGNGFALSTAVTTAGELTQNLIDYALELARKATTNMNREYLQSVANLMVIKGRPHFHVEGSYVMSDVRPARFREVDFGWAKAMYGGLVEAIPIVASFYVPFENKKDEDGIVFPVCLPAQAMERFAKELNNLLEGHPIFMVSSLGPHT